VALIAAAGLLLRSVLVGSGRDDAAEALDGPDLDTPDTPGVDAPGLVT